MPVQDQGINLERYMLVPRTLIFLTRKDEILLLKGAENKRLWAGLYNGVGGHIEQGEDVLSSAQRELHEETGLLSSNLRLCGVITVDTQTNPGVGVFIFTGVCSEGEPMHSKEGTLEWVKISGIKYLPLVADLQVLLPKILDMKPDDPPFSAFSRYDDDGKLVLTIQ